MQTEDKTIARQVKNRKLTAEKRASESESVTIARWMSNDIALAASESE